MDRYDYRWLEALLSMIALNTAPSVADLNSGAKGTPMFVMAGACPSTFAGMQVCDRTSAREREACTRDHLAFATATHPPPLRVRKCLL